MHRVIMVAAVAFLSLFFVADVVSAVRKSDGTGEAVFRSFLTVVYVALFAYVITRAW